MMQHSPFTFPNGKMSKNRFVLAPMTNGQSNSDGSLGQDEFNWLRRFSEGGFGLMLTCASHISKEAQAWAGQLGIGEDRFIPDLKKLSRMIQSTGSLALMQLFHGGVRTDPKLTGTQPVSASAFDLDIPNFVRPRALSIAEIHQIVTDFAAAAKRAHAAGFDGVEIHGANGYLITQFLSTQTNLRDDKYGGSLENRARFALEIMRACKKHVPQDFIVGIRLSPENMGNQSGLDLDESIQVSTWLKQAGADYIHLSLGSALFPPRKYPESKRVLTEFFRQALGEDYPIISGGGIKNPTEIENLLLAGADLVYLGAAAIANPNFPTASLNPNYTPHIRPYPLSSLRSLGLSETLITYLKNFPLMVQEEH